MDVVVHAVAINGGSQRGLNAGSVESDVDPCRGGAREQAVEVAVEESEHPVMKADSFPDAIADKEAAVEHRHLCLVAREELAIDRDLD